MTNKLLVVGFVILLAVSSFSLGHQSATGGFFGSQTVNYSNSLSQAALYNSLASIVQDVQAVRSPIAGLISYSSSSFSLPAQIGTGNLATSSITSSTAGASALAGVLPGDFVWVTVASSSLSAKGLSVTGYAATDTVFFNFVANSSTFPSGLVSLNVRVLPAASFTAPAALNTVTSTSN